LRGRRRVRELHVADDARQGDGLLARRGRKCDALRRIVLAAYDADTNIVGTVQVVFAQPENQLHRA
jgi:hypothetical protein